MTQVSLYSLLAMGLAATVSARQCRNLTFPITISARNGLFDKSVAPDTGMNVTDFVLNLVQPGRNLTADLLQDYATVAGTYNIAATYCEPDAGPGKALQILTHGVGFDRSYWDFPFNNYNYSYVNAALDRGYSTFAFDRPGVGASATSTSTGSPLDPVNEVQTFLEVAALWELTNCLRNGNATSEIKPVYQRIVHVGHSFGSALTYGITALDFTVSDGIALTGFSQNGSFVPSFVLGGNFVPATSDNCDQNYPAGYVAVGSPAGVQTNFFAPGNFDPAIVEPAFRAQQPVSVGEWLTLAGPVSTTNSFAGPVLIVTGGKPLFCPSWIYPHMSPVFERGSEDAG